MQSPDKKRKTSGEDEPPLKRVVTRRSRSETQTTSQSDLRPPRKSYLRQSSGRGTRTRGQVYDNIQAQRAQELEAEKKAQEDNFNRLSSVENARIKAPDGYKGDGKLHMAFIQMGQGDCTIISTPAGKSILIDCGSTATETGQNEEDVTYHSKIADIIFGQGFLATDNCLDILILTHPDRDHYNMLQRVIAQKRLAFMIEACYHSCTFGEYSQVETSNWIWHHMKEVRKLSESKNTEEDIVISTENTISYPIIYAIREVTARATYQKRSEFITPSTSFMEEFSQERTFTVYNYTQKKSSVADIQQPPLSQDLLDARNAIKVLQEEHCTVSLLASNVGERDRSTDDDTFNKCSIVVLIEAFGQKIMICGDATGGTENFICRTYPNVQDLDLLQVPHHGSVLTSSTQKFIDQMQPKRCIISAPKAATQHPHPSMTVINRYLKYANTLPENQPSYDATVWEMQTFAPILANSTKVDIQNIQKTAHIDKAIYITGSYGTYIYEVSDPNNATPSSTTITTITADADSPLTLMDTKEDTVTTTATHTGAPVVPTNTIENTTTSTAAAHTDTPVVPANTIENTTSTAAAHTDTPVVPTNTIENTTTANTTIVPMDMGEDATTTTHKQD